MSHETIKSFLDTAILDAASHISDFTVHSETELSRSKKLPAKHLISFLINQGSSSTKNELLDYFHFGENTPTNSAFNQQRAKLKPEALQDVFYQFNQSAYSSEHFQNYRYLAADGSTFTFFSKPTFADDSYYISGGHSAKGFYSMHLNALYDLQHHVYTDALIQPIHEKDEFSAFCSLVDKQTTLPDVKNIYIGDRGYCSYNNMAHVLEQNQFFLLRTKDIFSKGLVQNFNFPDTDSFDIDVTVTVVRSHSKKINNIVGYKRFIGKSVSFDFIEYGSLDTYEMSFRVVRFPISDISYECIVTNLPREEFPGEGIKSLYFYRWGIETSFRKLKYTIGLSNFHAYKPEYIKQEIWAKMIAYNATETIINHTIIAEKERKYAYQVNFTIAAHICKHYLRLITEIGGINVMELLKRELIPVRIERQYKRLQTAHFRKPRHFLYRAA